MNKSIQLILALILLTAGVYFAVTMTMGKPVEPSEKVCNYILTSEKAPQHVISEDELYAEINQYRIEQGLKPLCTDNRLRNSAKLKAQDMVDREYWAHYLTSTEVDTWTLLDASKYPFIFTGENLAKGYDSAPSIIEAWKQSPTHNENLVNPSYEDMGLNIKCVENWMNEKQTCLVILHLASEKDGD